MIEEALCVSKFTSTDHPSIHDPHHGKYTLTPSMLAGRSIRHRVEIHKVGDLILDITQNLDGIRVPNFQK